MSKSTNRRKSIAIALAVLGVAGLSLASASQLGLTQNNTVQSGALVVADCQPVATPITVTFAQPVRSGATYTSATVDLAGISGTCADGKHKYQVALLGADSTAAPIFESSATALGTATSISIAIPTGQDNNIKTVALTIYS